MKVTSDPDTGFPEVYCPEDGFKLTFQCAEGSFGLTEDPLEDDTMTLFYTCPKCKNEYYMEARMIDDLEDVEG